MLPIAGKWSVDFATPAGKTFQREFAALESWTKRDDELRFFSGPATYRIAFDVPADRIKSGQRARIDLGAVEDLAVVTVNGQTVATLWTKPFSADVTAQLKAGRNTLEVEIRNRWVNRLMGDDRLPPELGHHREISRLDS